MYVESDTILSGPFTSELGQDPYDGKACKGALAVCAQLISWCLWCIIINGDCLM